MASSELIANIKSFIAQASARDKLLLTLITGSSTTVNLAALNTTDKSNLVNAINELITRIVSAGGAVIDDTAASTSKAYSSQKVVDLMAALKAQILGGAGTAIDTLQELYDSDQSGLAALTTLVGNKVDFSQAQSLTTGQKTQALSNIGAASASSVGDTTTDLAAYYTSLLA